MLQFENKIIPQGIEWLKGLNNIYIYGNGAYANHVLKMLSQFNINVEAMLVSPLYYECISPKGIINAEEFFDRIIGGVNIIVGFCVGNHPDLFNSLTDNPKIDKVIIVDGCDYLFGNRFVFPDNPKIKLIDSYYNGVIRRGLSFEYYMKNEKEFSETYNCLNDEKSKTTMRCYLQGHIELKEFSMKSVWKEEDVLNQYFPEDIIKINDEEVFVDCGAYTGDTLQVFLDKTRNFQKYIAFEPDQRRYEDLKSVAGKDNKIIVEHAGAWSHKTKLWLSQNGECGEIIDERTGKGAMISVTSIDGFMEHNEIGKVSFIKMDIEGAELEALKGAKNTIAKYKPKLAICVYHKREDLITIPQYIKSINANYKLYLRAHFPYVSELVLYAV